MNYKWRDSVIIAQMGCRWKGDEIRRIVSGVTACQLLLTKRFAYADAILVHHGYFGAVKICVIGQKYRRLKTLLDHDMSLFAYHLPLDSHPTMGNNAQLAQRLQLEVDGRFGDDEIGWLGRCSLPGVSMVSDLAHLVEQQLGRVPTVIGDPHQIIGRGLVHRSGAFDVSKCN